MPHPAFAASLAIFCRVVDNFGDIGICWRLARQFAHEHGLAVTLWVDDLASFQRLHPGVDAAAARQRLDGIEVRHWQGQDGSFAADDVADIVIEFFGCELPPAYVEAMAARASKPLWFNYEGLTAEEWVEGCHRLPSMHPRLPLTKHFFFPGFTAQTGGLLKEAGLADARTRFRADPAARTAFLTALGLTPAEQGAQVVSLFCYPHAPLADLFAVWAAGPAPLTCLLPAGVATDAAQAFFGGAVREGEAATRGMLTLRILPFLPQPDYDRLLWACDFNFVRGEDSFVRAQWANRPFAWHIYPQDENLHHKKLQAFFARYAAGLPALAAFSLHWNGAAQEPSDWPALWAALAREMDKISIHAAQWEAQMTQNGEAARNLLAFAREIQSAGQQNPV